MATIVCHRRLQSCLESQLVEPRATRVAFSSPRPQFCQPLELAIKSCYISSNAKEVEDKCCYEEVSKKTDSLHDKHIPSNPYSAGWSLFEALSNGSQSSKETAEKENTYVHPLIKRSLSTLSERSLELCTENLGSETGSDILEDSIFSLSSSDSDGGNSPTRKPRQLLGAKKAICRNFPPPLTTISGSKSLRVRSHREDGRLVIKAVKAPSTNTLFQAERSNGRLRLCLLKYATPSSGYEEETVDQEMNGRTDEDSNEEEIESDSNYEVEEEEERGEMGMKNFQRHGRGRCKEGERENKGLLNWEPFWVATS